MRASARFLAQVLILIPMLSPFALFAQDGKITVFVAKKIITMSAGWPTATAVAVRDGKILSVGTLEDLKPWLDKNPNVTVDRTFADKVLMPGFIEAHGHPLLGGILLQLPLLTNTPMPNPYGPGFKGLKTRQEAIAALTAYEHALKDPNQRLLAWGFDNVVFGGHLTRQELDKISATRPIYVWDASEHFAYLNSAAIKQRGFTAEAAKKVNGVQLSPDGELNGQFLGTTAAIYALTPLLDQELKGDAARKSLDFLTALSLQGGITTQSELVLGVTDIDGEAATYEQYYNDASTPMRCVVVTDIAGLMQQKKDNAVSFILQLQQKSTDKLIYHGVKSFSDDSFVGFGMAIENPGYIDGRKGIYINQGDAFYQQLKPFWDAGLQIHVHSIGNGGQANTLQVLSHLQAGHPRVNHRFTFEHFGISTPAQIRELKELGAIASLNPYFVYYRAEINAPYFGTDRAYTAVRLRTLVDNGVTVSLHSDTPIGPALPLEWVWIAVNRFGQSGEVVGPEERVTVAQALRMITIDAAYTLGVDDKIGSIESGKFADFTVLEEDPYQVPADKLRDIKVWGTVVGGTPHPVSSLRAH